jgi:phospholipid transport system transporter-binding protein
VSKLNIIDKGGGLFAIDGDLTFATIDKKTLKSSSFLNSGKEITIDLAQVASTDSAGLALLIEWLKHARTKRTHLHFRNIPQQLLTLAKLSGFDKTSHFNIQRD